MDFQKTDNGLRLIADPEDRAALREVKADRGDSFSCDEVMADVMEHFIANSEFDWVTPEEAGCLTDAPLLGVRDENGEVVEVYGFMDYQVTSVQDELLDRGEAIFQKG